MPVEPPSDVHVSYRQQYRRCGKAGCGRCAGSGPGHGPYWYAQWRAGGRHHTRYLGKAAPPAGLTPPAERAPLPLRVKTLGGFAVWRHGQEIPAHAWQGRRIGVLFKWLLASPGHRLTRDQALEQLWPEDPAASDGARLRLVLHRLRKALGDPAEGESPLLRLDGEWLVLAPESADQWLDADAFLAAARLAQAGNDPVACRAALALYTGEFLPGDLYGEWALAPRDRLRQARIHLLLHHADLCQKEGDIEEAIGSLHLVLADDRCHEEAALALMRLHAATSRPAAALRVYQQLVEGLRDELDLPPGQEAERFARSLRDRQGTPPPVPRAAGPNNLPAGLTSFVGRARELAALRALLGPGAPQAPEAQPCRLLTLVGPGGIGKTRLALALAEDLLELYPAGVWLVDLSALPPGEGGDPAVAQTVRAALRLPEEAGRPPIATLVEQLRERRLLVVLDNCEHVLPACAALVATLLTACPAVRVLATSRETLGVPGEQPWSVPTLSQPALDGSLEQMAGSEAVRLFLARARLHRPTLTLTDENAGAVAAICRRLDGLPLALELAAARAGVLSLAGIAARLGDSLRLLTGGPRAAPSRQRTLRATLDWSYDLLGEPERRLLRRLAVFAGGFTLDAAQAGRGGEEPEVSDPLDDLNELIQKSLVLVEDPDGTPRYRLLETVRQYAWERLAADGEEDATRRRHAEWYSTLAEEAAQGMRGAEQARWLDQLAKEHDNARAALAWSMEHDLPRAARLAVAYSQFWRIRGHIGEGRSRLEAILAARAPIPPETRAAVLDRACILASLQGDLPRALVLADEGIRLQHRLGNPRGMAQALGTRGTVAWIATDYDEAGRLYEESLALFRELDDLEGRANALNNRAMVASVRGRFDLASTLYGECLALLRQVGNPASLAQVLMNQGISLHEQGSRAEADPLYQECLTQCRAMGNQHIETRVLNWLAISTLEQGDEAEAARLFEECLRLAEGLSDIDELGRARHYLGVIALSRGEYGRAEAIFLACLALRRKLGQTYGIAANLERLGQIRAAMGQPAAAARLLGAAEARRTAIHTPISPRERPPHDRAVAAIRAALGDPAYIAAWNEGQTMDLDEVKACPDRAR